MRAVGLKTHIWNNNLRSGVLLAGFPVLLLVIVFVVLFAAMMTGVLPVPPGGNPVAEAAYWMLGAAPMALVVAGVWFLIAYFANTAIVAAATGARPVERAVRPELYNLLENLCISRGLKMPKLNIIDTPALNAFASGVNDKQYTVTVTTGLLAALETDELEAVLAHELTHITNRDVRTMIVAAVFAGIFTLITELLFRALRFGSFARSRGKNAGAVMLFMLIALVAVAIGRLLAIVIRMSLSRTREFVADAGAAELTKNPDAMIRALQKISGSEPLRAPEEVKAMFVDNPGKSGLMGLFATHPPIPKRIEALVQFAGGKIQADPIVQAGRGPWG